MKLYPTKQLFKYAMPTLILPILLLAGCGGETPSQPAATNTSVTTSSSSQATSTSIEAREETQGVAETPGASTFPSGGMDLTTLDPCTLLTEGEVEAVLGPVEYSPELSPLPGTRSCVYVPQSESTDPLLEVRVGPPPDSQAAWEEDKAFLGATGDPVMVTGIGDEALTVDAITWQRLMVLLRGKAVVEVLVYPPNAEHAKQVALKVIERLP